MNWKSRNDRCGGSGLRPAVGRVGSAGRDRKVATAILLLCLLALPAAADGFQAANALYDAGKFGAAAAAYGRIEPKTAAVYFNLGNAHYRQEQLGLAVLNFERARQLAPRDPDVLANLRFAEARLGVAEINRPPGAVRSWWESFVANRTTSEWSILEIAALWLCILLAAGWLWLPRWRFGLGLAFAVALLWLAVTGGVLVWRVTRPPVALAVAKAAARFAPLEQATVHFEVSPGTKLGVIEDRGQWWFVERADGRRAWVRSESLAAR